MLPSFSLVTNYIHDIEKILHYYQMYDADESPYYEYTVLPCFCWI